MMDLGLSRRQCLGVAAAWCAVQAARAAESGAEIREWPASIPAPAFEALDLNGKAWNLAALRGRAVAVNFWASWCEPCRTEMPTLQQMADFYGDDRLVVLALNFKEAPGPARRFASRTGLNVPVLLDPQGEIARRWEVKVFPSTMLIARDGRPRWRVRGELDWTGKEAGRLIDGLFV